MKKIKINIVFLTSIIITLAIVSWAILGNASFNKASNHLLLVCTKKFGWIYLVSMTFL